ncbi:MAG: hypothetical protein CL816_02925 [Coxiellaceae bacterium]|nr:hypothetical protein [Coxiellaceae bacterium]
MINHVIRSNYPKKIRGLSIYLWLILVVVYLFGFLSYVLLDTKLFFSNPQLFCFTILSSIITLASLFISPRLLKTRNPSSYFIASYLISMFCLIISLRLSSLSNAYFSETFWFVAFSLNVIRFFSVCLNDIWQVNDDHEDFLVSNNVIEWQLLVIRLAIGLDLIPHFCEKLFAGESFRFALTQNFEQLGLGHNALLFVILSGFIELFGAFSISCGFLTRLGSICLFIYIIVAAFLGHHFALGFMWVNRGGGWEFPVLWSILILSFSLFGACGFSLDFILNKHLKLPSWVRWLL